MLRNYPLGVMLLLMLGRCAVAQDVPEFTDARKDAVIQLLGACILEKGLKIEPNPSGKGNYFKIVDRDKVRAAVASRHDILKLDHRDGLLAFWYRTDDETEPAVSALLEAYGLAKKDPLALGLAVFHDAKRADRLYRPADAVSGYKAALKHFATAKDLSWQGCCVNNLAVLAKDRGAFEEAADLFKQALEMARKQFPPERFPDGHPDIALGLNNLAALRRQQGAYADSIEVERQVLAMQRKLYPLAKFPDGHVHIAGTLNNLALSLHDQGAYADTVRTCQQALEMYRRLYPASEHPDGHPILANSLNTLGYVLSGQGALEEAALFYRQALAMRRKLFAPERFPQGHPDVAGSLSDLGALLWKWGDAEEAGRCMREALALRRRLFPVSQYPDGHRDVALSLNNLGLFLLEQDSADPQRYLEEALEMNRKLYPPSRYPNGHPMLAQTLNNLSEVYRKRGEHSKASQLQKEALLIRGKLYPASRYPAGHPDIATSVNNVGAAFQRLGAYSDAVGMYERAAQELRTGPDPVALERGAEAASRLRPLPMMAVILTNRAWASELGLPAKPSVAELRRCEQAYALSAAVQERLRLEVLRHDADRIHHGELADLALRRRVGLLGRIFEAAGDATDLAAAFRVIEQGRARVFLEALGEAHAGNLAGLPEDLRRQERELSLRLREFDARIQRLATLPGEEPAQQVRQFYADRLKVEAEQKRFQEGLWESHPQYAGFRYPSSCSIQQARDCLGDNETALLFVVGDDVSNVLLLEKKPRPGDRGNGLALFSLPGAKELDPLVDTLLAAQTLQRPALVHSLAMRLHQKVLAPLAERLAGKDLLIIADGTLALVPLEMLRAGNRWLLEKHRIRYAPSLTALHLSRNVKRRATSETLWALADPIFDGKDVRFKGQQPVRDSRLALLRGGSFERLYFSLTEVEAICKALNVPLEKVLRNEKALEARVKEASRADELVRARYVHFATHGELGKDRTVQPRLVLGQVGNDDKEEMGGPNDGYLTLPEVTFLKLNSQVVVLSACETGKGRRDRGEGVSGLARAFLYAGSKGVVCSLWSVDDARTAELMADFYKGLKEEKPTGEALRGAQLKMIRAGRAPFFWAPFVLMGE